MRGQQQSLRAMMKINYRGGPLYGALRDVEPRGAQRIGAHHIKKRNLARFTRWKIGPIQLHNSQPACSLPQPLLSLTLRCTPSFHHLKQSGMVVKELCKKRKYPCVGE
jgi:hypothetical protein